MKIIGGKVIRRGIFLIIGVVVKNLGFCETPGFSEIILKDYIKSPQIKHINSLVIKAEALMQEDLLKNTEELLKENIKKEPNNFLYRYFLARIYNAFGTLYKSVKPEIYKAKKIHHDQRAFKKIAKRYYELALKEVNFSIKLNRDFSDSWRLGSDLYGILIPLKNPMIFGMLYGPKALKYSKKALELCHNNPEAYLAIGRYYFFTPKVFGGDEQQAEKYFRKAISVCPSYDLSYVWLGWLHEKKGEIFEAKECYEKAYELNPNNSWVRYDKLYKIYIYFAKRYEEEGKLNLSKEYYQKAYELNPYAKKYNYEN